MKILGLMMIGPDQDEMAKEAMASAEGLVDQWVVEYPGQITDFAENRNELFVTAALYIGPLEDGPYWALMLDTDERLIWTDDVKNVLESTTADVLMVEHESGSYEKERFFRLPVRGHYVGPTHEAFITDEGAIRTTPIMPMRFTEIPKTPEQYRAKAERDQRILEAYTKAHPKDPRWWYYLGDTYVGLGETSKAKQAFWECQILDGWDEECAWANYRIATIEYEEKLYSRALGSAGMALERRADLPEAAWLAGLCRYYQGDYADAYCWGRMALTLLDIADQRKVPARIGFREPGIAVLVHDLLSWAAQMLGRPDEAQSFAAYKRIVEHRVDLRERQTQEPRGFVPASVGYNRVAAVEDQAGRELDAALVEAERRAVAGDVAESRRELDKSMHVDPPRGSVEVDRLVDEAEPSLEIREPDHLRPTTPVAGDVQPRPPVPQ